MEEIELGITNKEKLNIYITFFQNNYKNIVRFDLNSNPDEYLETLKIIILSRLIIIWKINIDIWRIIKVIVTYMMQTDS